MTNLQQDEYEDDNGAKIAADKVDYLAPYVHRADGFYNWTCGNCKEEHADRWWNISGRVLKCPSCQKMNLLVRTNCTEITALAKRNFDAEYDKQELERLRGIEKYNQDQIAVIRRDIIAKVSG